MGVTFYSGSFFRINPGVLNKIAQRVCNDISYPILGGSAF